MSKTRKTRCCSCQSLSVVRWGKQLGKQRFKCKECGLLFTRSNLGVSKGNCFIWFLDWIVGTQTYEQINSEKFEKTFYPYKESFAKYVPLS